MLKRPTPTASAPLLDVPSSESLRDSISPSIESWDFRGADTQYATHCLHTYLAAMIPQLARRLIERYVPAGGSVLDPFCGGGAVLVEALLSGREAAGRDINDLAVLVSKAKTTHLDGTTIEATGSQVLQPAKAYDGPILTFKKSDYVHYWFKPYMLRPLTGLRLNIDSVADQNLNTLLKVLFSATVRAVSLTYRNEIRLRRMNFQEQEKFNPDVFKKFEGKLREAIEQVPQLPKGVAANVAKGEVRSLPFRSNEFNAIICSPPYGDERNGVPYTQFAKNMLLWIGYSGEDLMKSKRMSLGWRKARSRDRAAPPSNTLLRALERVPMDSSAVADAIAFYADYLDALREMIRVVRDRVIIVIGQRVLMNTIFDNAKITTELMDFLGVPLEAHFVRKLPSKRLPKMREFGAAISQENILVFRK